MVTEAQGLDYAATVRCIPCGHAWAMKQGDPLRCPACNSTYFSTAAQVRT